MSQAVEVDLKHDVLLNDSLGPRKSGKCKRPSAGDFRSTPSSCYAWANCRPARTIRRPAGSDSGSACICWVGTTGSIEILKQADGGAMAHSTWPSAHFARQEYPGRSKATRRPRRPATDAGEWPPWARRVAACAATAGDPLDCARPRSIPLPACPVRTNGRVPIRPSLPPPCPSWAATRTRSWSFSSGPWKPTESPGVLFGLALGNDRHGNDDTAMELYKRAAERFPAHVGSLIEPRPACTKTANRTKKPRQCLPDWYSNIYPDHSPGRRRVLQRHRGLARARSPTTMRRSEETRPDGPGAQHSGDRFRAPRSAAETACKRWAS